MAESAFKNAYSHGERTQEEENSRATLPVIVENCAERSDIPDTEEKKNSSEKSRKKVGSSEKKKKKSALSENKKKKAALSEKTRKQTWTKLTSSICFLDVWNMRFPEAKQGTEEENRRRGLMLGFDVFDIDARKLREKNPHCIPVSVEKDARSDIPEIDMKKYHVVDDMPLGEFVYLIRWRIRLSKKKPIFVFFKNTKPPMDALMSAIDEENKDEDGFLHVTYSGEEENVNKNSRSGSFALAEGSFKQENPLERTQAEENTPNPMPMIVENAAAGSDTPDVEYKKNSSERKRKQGCSRVFYHIASLDMWNSSAYKMMVKKAATEGPGGLGVYGWSMMRLKNIEYRRACGIDARQLREKHPDYIPVTVEKDAKSDIPEVDMKIHRVHGDAPLEYFVHFMEAQVRRDWTRKPVFVFFKNTKPTMDALMSAIYEENKDEDGFLHVTYSGQERLSGSNEDQQECS